jgi:hypothetical protein
VHQLSRLTEPAVWLITSIGNGFYEFSLVLSPFNPQKIYDSRSLVLFSGLYFGGEEKLCLPLQNAIDQARRSENGRNPIGVPIHDLL